MADSAAPCRKCKLLVKKIGVQCDCCHNWLHRKCAGLTITQYRDLTRTDSPDWKCNDCTSPTNPIPLRMPDVISPRVSSLVQELRQEADTHSLILSRLVSDLASLSTKNTICEEAIANQNVIVNTLRESNYTLCDLLTQAHARISELESNTSAMSRKIVTDCTETLQRHKNLVFTNVPENPDDSTANNRRALVGYLNQIFTILQITSPFSAIKRFQRLGKFGLKQNRSVVVEFTTSLARDSVLSRSKLLATSTLPHIGIVPDLPSTSKHCLEFLKAPPCKTCRITITPLVPGPISSSIEPTQRPAPITDCLPSMTASHVQPPPKKPANRQNTTKINGSKNGYAPHRNQPNQPNPLLVRPKVSRSSTQMLPVCGTKSMTSGTALPIPPRMLLRSQKRGAITS